MNAKHTPEQIKKMLHEDCEKVRKRRLLEAAAPDMAEVLKVIAEWACDCDFPLPGETGRIWCGSCLAKAALKKAGML